MRIWILLLTVLFTNTAAHAASVKETTIDLVHQILNDPLLTQKFQDSRLEVEQEVLGKSVGSFSYQIVRKNPIGAFDKVSLIIDADGTYSAMIFLENEDNQESTAKPNWPMLSLQWDKFINRYWPTLQLKRNFAIGQAWKSYRSNRGLFTVTYAHQIPGVQNSYFAVDLDVRLSDGKIGGVKITDSRTLLKNQKVTPAPADSIVLAQILKQVALTKVKSLSGFHNARITEKIRYFIIEPDNGVRRKVLGLGQSLKVMGDNDQNNSIVIEASNVEKTGKVSLDGFDYSRKADKSTENELPTFTSVVDEQPSWAKNGSILFCVSTRDVRKRAWWNRDSTIASIMRYEMTQNNASLLRPIKPLRQDFGSYRLQSSEHSDHLLITSDSLQTSSLLDTQKGILYFPEPDAATRARILEFGGREDEIEPLNLQIAGAAWLPAENGLVLSITNRDRDPNLYVARWDKDAPPQAMELVPLVYELGDDVLPELSADGKTLAWARKIYKRERDKAPGEADKWQLMLADFDAEHLTTQAPAPKPGEIVIDKDAIAKANTRRRRTLDLPAEPLSIAWDETQKRWLIVTRSQVLWVQETQNGPQVLAAPALNWKGITLHPTSADVSRDGRIAIAAALETPQVYAQTECVVRSLILLWDGLGTTVQPAYEPSLNGLPRYVFPQSGQSWARIRGDAKRLGLQGRADPAWFDAVNTNAATAIGP